MGSQGIGVALRGSPRPRVERPAAGTVRKQHEQPAPDGQILLEMRELVAIAELDVKQHGRGYAKAGEQERCRTGVVAEQNQNCAACLQCDCKRHERARHTECLRVEDSRRIARELAPSLMQEQRGNEEAAGKRGRLLHLDRRHSQFTFALPPPMAFSRSASSSQPEGHSSFSRATFCFALSLWPVSTSSSPRYSSAPLWLGSKSSALR